MATSPTGRSDRLRPTPRKTHRAAGNGQAVIQKASGRNRGGRGSSPHPLDANRYRSQYQESKKTKKRLATSTDIAPREGREGCRAGAQPLSPTLVILYLIITVGVGIFYNQFIVETDDMAVQVASMYRREYKIAIDRIIGPSPVIALLPHILLIGAVGVERQIIAVIIRVVIEHLAAIIKLSKHPPPCDRISRCLVAGIEYYSRKEQ